MIRVDSKSPRDARTSGGVAPDTGRYPMHDGSYDGQDARLEARFDLYSMNASIAEVV